MILSLKQTLSDFFLNILDNFTISSLFTLITGIFIGFMLCLLCYFLLIVNGSKSKKKVKEIEAPKVEIEDNVILEKLTGAKNEYNIEYSQLTINEKIGGLKDICYNLMYEIAHLYYPESKYPIYELSIDELLSLCNYIADRLNTLLSGKITRHFKKIKVSQIFQLLDLKKKAEETKVIKAANKLKLPKITTAVLNTVNILNPVHWVKKVMINTTLLVATNKLAQTIIDIVGEETTKVYSKSVFNKETNIDTGVSQTIEEIEHMVNEG